MVAYADGAATRSEIRIFPIEQLVAPGEVAARPLLPSVRYHPAPGELTETDIRVPWPVPDPGRLPQVVLGELARAIGSRVPGRLVASAKSWLSHPAVDRTAPILPWGGVQDVPKISPVNASASYLAYVRAAWNDRFGEHPLESQETVLTVPASFDEAARSLTMEAARIAGLPHARLLEEPQAACYDWIHRHRQTLASDLGDTRLLLVCDVGGGTTDLTLIRVALTAQGPRFTRIGVGDHLMLGGDNMDLALAHTVEKRLGGIQGDGRLSAAALSQLVQQCRSAKERLLAADGPERVTVAILGAGARLIGGARSAELTREEVRALVVDGFLPRIDASERPHGRRSGIVEFGLPYAADPAITRHVAAFLAQHSLTSSEALGERTPADGRPPVPDGALLNGGVFNSAALARRLLEVLADWRGEPLRQLDNEQPELAVARGAVAYAMARRGEGLRIGGGSARSYFLIVESPEEQQNREQDRGRQRGVCLLPRGTEEDREIRLTGRTFLLRLGEPVRFHLVSSTGDTPYEPGDLLDIDYRSFATLPPIATVLGTDARTGEVPVQLVTMLTEVGTLEMNCVAVDDPERRWRLAFELRGEGQAVVADSAHPRFSEAAALIELFYGTRSKEVGPKAVKSLRTDLERILGKRESWDTPLLRELFGALWNGARRRWRSPDHERLWLSLAGFCLRPGFGYPLDDWRVQQLWSIYDQGVQHRHEPQIWAEWWTLWRRVAGGLDDAAQERILEDIADELKPARRVTRLERTKSSAKQGHDDRLLLLGSLERLSMARKTEAGRMLIERLRQKGESPQTWWAVGRLGARVPLYGSIHHVILREAAAAWLAETLKADWRAVQPAAFAAVLLARLSGDRERDLEEGIRRQVAQKLRAAGSPESWIHMVEEVVELDEADERRVFGEALPPGLRLVG